MAQERFRFFNSAAGDERPYDASDMAVALRTLAADGVGALNDTCLKVSAEGATMRTLVGYGTAYVQGYHYELRDDGSGIKAFTHATTADLDRIDRIVIRLDITARTIILAKKVGIPDATPVAPALTRTSDIYELAIAQVRVRTGATEVLATDVVDERANENVCGVAVPEGVKLSTLWQRLIAYATGVDALRWVEQTLTEAQKTQIRTNIDAANVTDFAKKVDAVAVDASGNVPLGAVRYNASMGISDAEKAQARANMGAQKILDATNTLPLAAGGLGGSAANTDGARNLIGALAQPTLLWTNGSPTSTFAAQLINGAWSGFTSFIIEYTVNIAQVSHRCVAFVPSGESTPFHYLGSFATNYWRQTSINTGGVYFSDGYYRADGGAATADNTKMIPYKIWGVKEITL